MKLIKTMQIKYYQWTSFFLFLFAGKAFADLKVGSIPTSTAEQVKQGQGVIAGILASMQQEWIPLLIAFGGLATIAGAISGTMFAYSQYRKDGDFAQAKISIFVTIIFVVVMAMILYIAQTYLGKQS